MSEHQTPFDLTLWFYSKLRQQGNSHFNIMFYLHIEILWYVQKNLGVIDLKNLYILVYIAMQCIEFLLLKAFFVFFLFLVFYVKLEEVL